MNSTQTITALFPTKFSEEQARKAVAGLCETALAEWKSNLQTFYDCDESETDEYGNLLQPELRSLDEVSDGRQLRTASAPPAAEKLTSAKIAQLYAAGEDPWACDDLEISPLWDVKPRPAAILATLLFCASFRDQNAIEQIYRSGCITLLICPSKGMRSNLHSVLPDLVKFWKAEHPNVAAKSLATHSLDEDASARDKNRGIEQLRRSIDKNLQQHGATLAICAAPSQLSEEQGSLVRQVLRLPRISAAAIIETLRYTHSNTRQLAEDELIKRLPDADALRRLEPLQINAAFEESTTLRVADRLAEIARAQKGSSSVTLDDVKGLGSILTPLQRIVSDLEFWKQGRVAWSDVTRSALLYGPPGTGKTMLANAVAGSSGVPLIATSYSDCQKAGHQGEMLAALSAEFERAAQVAPAVLFIDELDSFSRRSTRGQNNAYLRGVVNGLLEQINAASQVEGLIILGATNHLNDVDPAVVRSGRFDLKLEIQLPDRAGIEAILGSKLGDRVTPDLNLRAIADRLLGAAGAVAEALVRDALGRARADRAELRQEHLEAAADAVALPVDPALLKRIAVHEAGHVLAAILSPLPVPVRAWVSQRSGFVEPGELPTLTPDMAEAQLQMLLAGRAAEVLLLEQPSNGAGLGPSSDLAQATKLAAAIEVQFGFGGTGLTWFDVDSANLQLLPAKVQKRIHAHLSTADKAVSKMLVQNISDLKQISAELMQRRELHPVDLQRIAKRIAAARSGGASPPARCDHSEVSEETTSPHVA